MRTKSVASLIVALALGTVFLAAAPQVVSPQQASALKKDYPYVRFEALAAFPLPVVAAHGFKASPHRPAAQAPPAIKVPADIQKLDGTRVSLRGYQLPINLDRRGVSVFLLSGSIDSCHFGTVGAVNEWVLVSMNSPVPYEMGRAVTVFGRFKIAPEYAGGDIVGLYEMAGDHIAFH
jgi:hypothetical protein